MIKPLSHSRAAQSHVFLTVMAICILDSIDQLDRPVFYLHTWFNKLSASSPKDRFFKGGRTLYPGPWLISPTGYKTLVTSQ